GDGPQLTASLSFAVNSDLTGVRLVLEPAPSIPVVVKMETTATQTGTLRGNRPRLENMAPVGVHLRPSELSLGGGDYWANVEALGKQSSLALRGVEPGRYSVEVTPNGPWYVQSAQCGEADLLREDLAIAGGVRLPPIEVVLRDDAATVVG